MTTRLNPYLSFGDQARAAMEFYRSVFGGELTLSTFSEFDPTVGTGTGAGDGIMHGQLEAPNGMVLMGADTPPEMSGPTPNGTVSLSGDDESELRGYWDGLADGAQVTVPLEKAPWGDSFGMLTDRFGVGWMVNISEAD
ncbi:VOC family protein [Mumia sp. zg.B21]|uniref:VOC family protein n=1 Tax=Mumia sp. zg.B21 TaxID=2855447 RepID=UPI001C6EE453|nr:VOC family protein [Mumia sp. zg.B21]MBW9208940.1 VOC family protein [Mumia sp. zg.B21]